MLPNFICIGAQKCGTTSIWHILNAHPDICMAQPRETRFFYDDIRFAEGLQQYEIQHFSHWAGETAIGEKCPEYLYLPTAANRIHDSLSSKTQFIVSLRSPAQRAFSHYRHNFNMLREFRTFDQALESEYREIQGKKVVMPPYGYLARGYYASQLQLYYSLFGEDQFLLINFEKEVLSNQQDLCDRLYSFLGVKRFYPTGIPFKSGHPPLENLSIQINQKSQDTRQHYIDIERVSYKFSHVHKLLRFIPKKIGAKQHKNTQRIYSPSESLIQFAHTFQHNRPIDNKLPQTEELRINRRYFQQEIEALSMYLPSAAKKWLNA